ncbi:MAG: prepilin-type N-terminal cleavage/methylation domain-containing protein [Planctomycetota bacterium]|nr:prepilin-type N-terminal cleavage/methylation domain-containing protein [Planctomycetota bacterium]
MLRLPRYPRRRAAQGMTLVEVLIASAILVFGMAGVLAIMGSALRTHQRARDETHATLVGASILAELQSQFASGIKPREIAERSAEAWPDDPRFKYTVRLESLTPRRRPVPGGFDFPVGEEFYVEVKVLWSDARDDKSAIFRTIQFLRPRE